MDLSVGDEFELVLPQSTLLFWEVDSYVDYRQTYSKIVFAPLFGKHIVKLKWIRQTPERYVVDVKKIVFRVHNKYNPIWRY